MKRIAVLASIVMALFVMFGVQSCQSTKSATTSKMLKFNFEKGKGYDYEMIINLDQEIMDQPMQMDMTSYYSMDVTGDDGSTKTITTTYDRFKMNMLVSGLNIEVDSDKPIKADDDDDKSMSAQLNKVTGLLGAIKGRRFVMKVNAEGKVEEVSGFEGMAEAIADSLQLNEAERAKMMSGFNQQFNEKEMKGQFERVLYIFPNKEVKVGDSWEKTTSAGKQMGGGTYTSTYTVKEIEGEMVTLEEKSKISAASGDGVSGNISGILTVDSKTGLVLNADQEMSIKTKAEGMEVEIKGKMKVKGKARQ